MDYVSILKKYNINYLTHFSNIYNLESILKYGILSKSIMNNNDIKYINSDSNRFDGKLNLISVSLNCINKNMLFKKRVRNTKLSNIWFILILDINLLNDKTINAYFCKDNAASKDISYILKTNIKRLNTIDALIEMIESDNMQKEILIENKIDIKYIKGIVVSNDNDKDMVKYILEKNKIDLPVSINNSLFY